MTIRTWNLLLYLILYKGIVSLKVAVKLFWTKTFAWCLILESNYLLWGVLYILLMSMWISSMFYIFFPLSTNMLVIVLVTHALVSHSCQHSCDVGNGPKTFLPIWVKLILATLVLALRVRVCFCLFFFIISDLRKEVAFQDEQNILYFHWAELWCNRQIQKQMKMT